LLFYFNASVNRRKRSTFSKRRVEVNMNKVVTQQNTGLFTTMDDIDQFHSLAYWVRVSQSAV